MQVSVGFFHTSHAQASLSPRAHWTIPNLCQISAKVPFPSTIFLSTALKGVDVKTDHPGLQLFRVELGKSWQHLRLISEPCNICKAEKTARRNYLKIIEINIFVKTRGTEAQIQADIKDSLLDEWTHLTWVGWYPVSLNVCTKGRFSCDVIAQTCDTGQDYKDYCGTGKQHQSQLSMPNAREKKGKTIPDPSRWLQSAFTEDNIHSWLPSAPRGDSTHLKHTCKG